MTRAFLGLGSNLGDSRTLLRTAVDGLGPEVVAVSDLYETAPVGGPEQPSFLNLVVQLDTDDSPLELLARCQALEQAADRVREVRWGPRTLDVDVLWIDGVALQTDQLTVPHPRMHERRFVLAPLAELAPELASDDLIGRAIGEVKRLGPL